MSDSGGNVQGRAHQARQITVTVTWTERGYLLESPSLPGWATHAHDQRSLAIGVRQAFTEHEVATYAAWRGTRYDLAQLEDENVTQLRKARDPHPSEAAPTGEVPRQGWAKGSQVRPDQYDPADWMPLPDGRWRSPSGRHYGPDTAMVASVCSRRAALGLPISA